MSPSHVQVTSHESEKLYPPFFEMCMVQCGNCVSEAKTKIDLYTPELVSKRFPSTYAAQSWTGGLLYHNTPRFHWTAGTETWMWKGANSLYLNNAFSDFGKKKWNSDVSLKVLCMAGWSAFWVIRRFCVNSKLYIRSLLLYESSIRMFVALLVKKILW